MRSFKHSLNPIPDFLFQPWIYQLKINLCENLKKNVLWENINLLSIILYTDYYKKCQRM